MERFCKDLRDHEIRIIFFEKKMILLTYEKDKSYEEQKVCYICEKEFSDNGDDDKKVSKK